MIVLLVGAAALDVTGRIAVIGPLKLTAYQALMALFVLLLLHRIRTGASRLPRTAIDVPLLAFAGLAVVSIVIASDRSTALVQAVSLGSSLLLAYGITVGADDEDRLQTVIVGTLVVGVAIAILGILERFEVYSVNGYLRDWAGAMIRSKATFKDPNIMGSFELTAIALSLPLALTARGWRSKAVLIIGCLITGIGLATTASRGALGGMLIALVVILLLSRIRLRAKAALFMAAIALAGFSLAFITSPQWIQSRVVDVGSDASALSRVYMAESALAISADHPLGVGIGNYTVAYPYYRNAMVRHDLVESHTAYFTVLVETGILGLIAFLSVLLAFGLATLRVIFRKDVSTRLHSAAVGSFAAAIGLAAQAFTYSLESSKFWWLAIGVGIAATVIARSNALKVGDSGSEGGDPRAST